MTIKSKKIVKETTLQVVSDVNAIQSIQPLSQRSMFWRPNYLENSAWLEHIPFAFWLIEAHRPQVFVELGTHYGVSYFAFCQAVEKLGLDTRCFSVDTWKGDEHAGYYDEKVFEKVKAYNEAQYSGFSRLVCSPFDDARDYFTDGSIDLLHIDGLHTLEAVTHDFENWLPKLSGRAVVVMHDSNVRERSFGVFKLFERLKERYPSFEFIHGHGLGVLQVGTETSELMQCLFKADGSVTGQRALQEVFSRLGRACADSFLATQQLERANNLRLEVDQQKKQLVEVKQALENNKSDLNSRTRELAESKARLQQLNDRVEQQTNELVRVSASFEKSKGDLNGRSQELADLKLRLQSELEQHSRERGQVAERVTLLQEIRTELKVEISRYQGRIDTISAELTQKSQRLMQVEDEHARQQQQLASIADKLVEREKTIGAFQAEVQECLAKNEDLRVDLQTKEAAIGVLQRKCDGSLKEIRQLQGDAKDRDRELAEVQDSVKTRFKELTTLTQMYLDGDNALRAREGEVTALKKQLDSQTTELLELTRKLDAVTKSKDEFAEKGVKDALALQQIRVDMQAREGEVTALKKQLDSQTIEFLELTRKLDAVTKSKDEFAEKGMTDALVLQQIRVDMQAREGEVAALKKQLDSQTTELKQMANKLEIIAQQNNELAVKGVRDGLALQQNRETLQARESEVLALKNQLESQSAKFNENISMLETVAKNRGELEEKRLAESLALQQTLADMQKENTLLQGEVRTLNSQKDEATLSLNDRDRELAALTQQLERTEKKLLDREGEGTALKIQLASKTSELDALKTKLKAQEAKYILQQKENEELLINKDAGRRNSEERFRELATLTQLLEEREDELATKDQAIEAEKMRVIQLKNSISWQITAPVRAFSHSFLKKNKEPATESEQIALVEQSGMFDKAWYLRQYPDVAKEGSNPIEHYIRHGASEGRNPGPNFDTQGYLARHPDIAAAGINPFVHYLKFGKNEGRS